MPNSFTAGATITASDHNENWSDAGSEITNSVAADGQTSMTGPLKCSSGTLTAPSQTFASDTDTGRYRKTTNTMADVCAGAEVVEISTTGIDVTGTMNADTVTQGGVAILPSGVIAPYAGSSAPTGWLLCDGSAVSRTTYAALFSIISTTYGTGNGSTTFNLPDLTGRIVAGKEASATRLTSGGSGVDGGTLGATGGSQTHTLTAAQSAALTYTSSVTDPGHTHTIHTYTESASSGGGSNFPATPNASGSTSSATTGITVSTTSNAGGGAHNNVQPTIVLNYIIKT